MSGAGEESNDRWTWSLRVIPGGVPRAQIRTTLTYRFHPRFTAGIEYNPRGESVSARVGPVANLLVMTETELRPALMVGTSSDRIGTRDGQSFYATLSKSLKRETGLPIAPYAGVAYSGFEDRLLGLGGLNINFTKNISSLVMFDGVHVHPMVFYKHERHQFLLILVRGRTPGVGYNITF
ncbi:MAG: hypothetical protein ACREBD_35040 [Blastocatellia bacterium]